MRKILAVSMFVLFAFAFAVGVMVTPAQAGPTCNYPKVPECINGYVHCCYGEECLLYIPPTEC